MKIYVVCEDYTCAFCDIFLSEDEAQECANEQGGYVLKAIIENEKIVYRDWD